MYVWARKSGLQNTYVPFVYSNSLGLQCANFVHYLRKTILAVVFRQGIRLYPFVVCRFVVLRMIDRAKLGSRRSGTSSERSSNSVNNTGALLSFKRARKLEPELIPYTNVSTFVVSFFPLNALV